MQVKDGKIEGTVQHNKDKNMGNSNNSADVDESFQMNKTTSENISSIKQNNSISADSLKTGMYMCCTWCPVPINSHAVHRGQKMISHFLSQKLLLRVVLRAFYQTFKP